MPSSSTAAGHDTITLASYNIHQWRGAGGKVDPERTIEAIRRLEADVVALQEVTCPLEKGCGHTPDDIGSALECQAILGPTFRRQNADFGNLILTRLPILETRRENISFRRREPRGVVLVRVDYHGTPIWVAATHLGLSVKERRRQAEFLIHILRDLGDGIVVLMGDLNEWNPAGYLNRKLRNFFGRQPAPPTFPAQRPFLPLDRILIKPYARQTEVYVPKGRYYSLASDHRPVVAKLPISKG